MADLLTPDDIELRARSSGVTMDRICRVAGVSRSTFTRWKQGKSEIKLASYARIVDAVAAFRTPATERPAAPRAVAEGVA